MKNNVSCIHVSEPKKQPTICPIRSGWKVERGDETQDPPDDVHDSKDLIIEPCLTGESSSNTKQPSNKVDDIVDQVGIEYAENSYYPCAILWCGKEPRIPRMVKMIPITSAKMRFAVHAEDVRCTM